MRAATLVLSAAGFALFCCAQTPVAPTPDAVGPTRGDDWQGYNITNSFETGYRFVNLSGNDAKYRSDENFGNGIRLLSGFVSLDSKNGHGSLFDQFLFTTNGLGGDPYSAASVRAAKNRLYQYNFLWRRNDYVNPGLTTDGSANQHLLDTSNTLQDHDLTLFPQSRVSFSLGYSRNAQSGAGISTVQLFQAAGPFDYTGQAVPVFSNINRVQNDYRLGADIHWLGFVLNVLHGWEDYKDDTSEPGAAPVSGDATGLLSSFGRTEPNHGTSPYWRVALFRDSRWLDINGRFTYTSGSRAFFVNEAASGPGANQQILSFGDARRPVATGNLNVSFVPTSKLTITSETSVYNVRTEGDSTYLQFNNADQQADLVYFQFLKIRTIQTDLGVHYQAKRWLDLHGGYGYSDRRIGSSPQFAFAGSTSSTPFVQSNILQSGSFGFRVTPLKGLSITADDELGRTNQPFTPRSEKDYNALDARVEYKRKSFQLRALSKTDYNANSITLSSYSSHARTNSVYGSWTVRPWLSLDAGYSKLHVDTLGGIAFFADSQFFPSQVSYYVSNLHSGTVSARLNVKRMDLFVNLGRVQDTGDGRSKNEDTSVGPDIPRFQAAQTFPLRFDSPSVRVSIRIRERLRWNAGYQYFGYREDFWHGENYHASTGFSSILWSF